MSKCIGCDKEAEDKKCSKCNVPLFWYEVTEGICYDCKSKILGIDKSILLQGVKNWQRI